MLGKFAGTSTFGGGNLTVYATESYDGNALQTWLFLTVIHKSSSSSVFTPKWLGILYGSGLANVDMAIVEYTTVGISLDIHIDDYYVVNSSYAAKDDSYTPNQGSQDVVTVMTAYDSSSYLVGSYKRKFLTGDVNRDTDIVND